MPATTFVELSLFQTVAVLSRVLETRDSWTAGHVSRVSDLSRRIAAALGLTAHEQDGVRIAGTLHDIGKIGVPSDILLYPGRLTVEQMALVRTHARLGAELLSDVDFPWPVQRAILQHHERLDGSGYPAGLRGEAICLDARIIAVADVVDAMSSDCAYRRSPGLGVALHEIRRGRGQAYDPDVVDACLVVLESQAAAPDAPLPRVAGGL